MPTLFVVLPGSLRSNGGVKDYAYLLSDALSRELSGYEIVNVECRKRADLEALRAGASRSGDSIVLVHYSNYGYHPRGCPVWLADVLEELWSAGVRRIFTIFHEVFATGSPWQSSFWLRPVQRRIARRVFRISDYCMTSLSIYKELLMSEVPARAACVQVFPVFSTIGELPSPGAWANRYRRLVVFGGAGIRSRAYARSLKPLQEACEILRIDEVIDIGPPADVAPVLPSSVSFRTMGVVPALEVSALLATAAAGFMDYPAPFLGKSTVFAAYAAHGMLPVCCSSIGSRGLNEALAPVGGVHYWVPGQDYTKANQERIARAAHDWYQGHTLQTHTRRLVTAIVNSSQSSCNVGSIC